MSASTTPTLWPRAARATARLVVTDDLPTPPLPDEISNGRVFDPGWLNGTGRPWAWPWAGPDCARHGGRVALQPTAQGLALLVGHHREVEGDAGDALERHQRGGDPVHVFSCGPCARRRSNSAPPRNALGY